MSMPAVQPRRWTADEVRALPDEPGKRFECVDGELIVSPGPKWAHQRAVRALIVLLHDYVAAHRVGDLLMGPGEVEFDPYTLVQPDLFVLPLVDGRVPSGPEDSADPLLVVEVPSPSTARYDRGVKRDRYQRAGAECWIVDLDSRVVERWLPGAAAPEVLREELRWHPAGAGEPLALALAPLFAEAHGER
ncbi:Uma2 family endonuclease [Roseisolibacter sp. H3M3-2]|uniref:Uma2 family endonuclease n=1 Tax=Roseisolibacter sp. H3M3-2 TaxID=3031323 RepID=UPI0023DC15E7|nr:Uma2 family endonuclease [Roseisolibacter sp. H3M3-2]MDF1501703.1 Uma2 family endonuclease [Roseisolibacter sp. H3M3-2]